MNRSSGSLCRSIGNMNHMRNVSFRHSLCCDNRRKFECIWFVAVCAAPLSRCLFASDFLRIRLTSSDADNDMNISMIVHVICEKGERQLHSQRGVHSQHM